MFGPSFPARFGVSEGSAEFEEVKRFLLAENRGEKCDAHHIEESQDKVSEFLAGEITTNTSRKDAPPPFLSRNRANSLPCKSITWSSKKDRERSESDVSTVLSVGKNKKKNMKSMMEKAGARKSRAQTFPCILSNEMFCEKNDEKIVSKRSSPIVGHSLEYKRVNVPMNGLRDSTYQPARTGNILIDNVPMADDMKLLKRRESMPTGSLTTSVKPFSKCWSQRRSSLPTSEMDKLPKIFPTMTWKHPVDVEREKHERNDVGKDVSLEHVLRAWNARLPAKIVKDLKRELIDEWRYKHKK